MLCAKMMATIVFSGYCNCASWAVTMSSTTVTASTVETTTILYGSRVDAAAALVRVAKKKNLLKIWYDLVLIFGPPVKLNGMRGPVARLDPAAVRSSRT